MTGKETTMQVIKPYVYLFESELDPKKLSNIERAARICYKSEDKMGDAPSETFLKNMIKHGHESVIEHEKVTAYFVVDRGVTHEIVRHRIASYSQESTRYCNYTSGKFGNEITVIEPFFYPQGSAQYKIWKKACENAEGSYFDLIALGAPQEARSVLPNSLKTEIAVTYNFREWRQFFRLRGARAAHPQIQQVTIPLLKLFQERFAPLFEDISYNTDFPLDQAADIRLL